MDIRYFIMDVDGTLTDGKIYMGRRGELFKAFHIKDGCGIRDILIPAGIRPVIITGRKSKLVRNRCRELGIAEIHQGVSDKPAKLTELLCGQSLSTAAYIGDDINDVSCMEQIREAGGLVGCPADAAGEVARIAHFISEKNGGEGAVREFIEWIVGQKAISTNR